MNTIKFDEYMREMRWTTYYPISQSDFDYMLKIKNEISENKKLLDFWEECWAKLVGQRLAGETQ